MRRWASVPLPNGFTVFVERDGDWYIAYSPEVPGANGLGKSEDEATASLSEAIRLILEDRRDGGICGAAPQG